MTYYAVAISTSDFGADTTHGFFNLSPHYSVTDGAVVFEGPIPDTSVYPPNWAVQVPFALTRSPKKVEKLVRQRIAQMILEQTGWVVDPEDILLANT
jgi:hypothetical protein